MLGDDALAPCCGLGLSVLMMCMSWLRGVISAAGLAIVGCCWLRPRGLKGLLLVRRLLLLLLLLALALMVRAAAGGAGDAPLA
jgi:hypothetical protein